MHEIFCIEPYMIMRKCKIISHLCYSITKIYKEHFLIKKKCNINVNLSNRLI